MKNAFIRCLLFVLIVVSLFACACNTPSADTSNNNNNQEVVTPEKPPEESTPPTVPEEPPAPQPVLISFDLTEDNYTDYLNIQISQSNQTSTLVNALYRIKYRWRRKEVWGLNPNLSNASSCKLIKTQYSITTTFIVSVAPTQTKYQYSGILVLIKYKTASTSIIVDEFGRGIGSFVLTESMYNRTGYDYTIYPESAVVSIVGGVYYYE